MVMYRKNRKWKPFHLSLDLKNLDEMESKIEEAIKAKIEKKHLTRQWKAIDIVDLHIISSTYQPTKETTFLDVVVFVADMTGEPID